MNFRSKHSPVPERKTVIAMAIVLLILCLLFLLVLVQRAYKPKETTEQTKGDTNGKQSS